MEQIQICLQGVDPFAMSLEITIHQKKQLSVFRDGSFFNKPVFIVYSIQKLLKNWVRQP